jgi:hypothetical protein
MNHKTLTTLGQLRIGDSFVYKLNRQDIWRVIAKADRSNRVAVNQIFNGKPIHKYDELKRASTSVVFLRHTVPVQGEEIFIEDLKEGDVFHNLEDIIHEYVIEKTGNDYWLCRRLDQSAPAGYWGRLTKVVFVRHKN